MGLKFIFDDVSVVSASRRSKAKCFGMGVCFSI